MVVLVQLTAFDGAFTISTEDKLMASLLDEIARAAGMLFAHDENSTIGRAETAVSSWSNIERRLKKKRATLIS